MQQSRTTTARFGEEHFGGAALGDRRRNTRLVSLANSMAAHPGGTLPNKLRNPMDLKALYRLLSADAVTHEAVLAAHIERTLECMRAHDGAVLNIHDTTELDYSGLKTIGDEVGQIGNGGGRGYKCHNSLAVTADSREAIGLTNQILFCRPKRPKKETKAQSRRRKTRESRLWKQGSEATPAAPADKLWVDVADCAADVTEFLDFEIAEGKHFLVRSLHNRWVQKRHEGDADRVKLHDWLRTFEAAGQRTVDVQAKGGQPARRADVGVAWAPVRVLPPRQSRGEDRGVPLAMWAVRVWELDPPADVSEPLEWILLTNVAVASYDDACERIDWYTCRWVVEEYHKAMKTGCNIESMEFKSTDRLAPAIALVSVLACFLLTLRDKSRRPNAKDQSARTWVPGEYVRVLSAWRYNAPDRELTVYEFCYALARLGGHQNRKNDKSPGWQVLWRGWTHLHAMVQGAAALGAVKCG